MFSRESDLLYKIRLVEWLKADLVSHVGELFHAMAQNSEKAIATALAAIIASCYVLGRRLGIDFSVLDATTQAWLSERNKKDQQVEKWLGDYAELESHFRQKR
ncbi:MazG-like family protein [Acetonema longum]|uniref:MazG-like family protein n=1 Tax=Acetonema longum DSM 6540 TaxID=1009370 RepID=F7NE38_9FIRM|nr:MazG-like family protein [Acetonema longum]EGO65693.1 hypothetical protein ALO_01504 [Acetonema longum DSM 6540]